MKILLFGLMLGLGLTSTVVEKESVSFTLRNNSLRSVPLAIPGVMNPNLSPMSNSGVSLEIGQKIFFFDGRKRHLLLEVSAELRDSIVLVPPLIKARKDELGL